MYEFKLPDLGEGIHEAEILKWYVAVGERVQEDAPLVEVETDKAAVTLPSPVAGVLVSRAGNVGDVLTVGQIVVTIDAGSGARVAAPAEPAPAAGGNGQDRRPAAVVAAAEVEVRSGPVPAAPATRRRARELGVDLRQVRGTGPGGRVTVQDVLKASAVAAGAPEATPAPVSADSALAPSTALEPVALPQRTGQGVGIPLLEIEPLPDFSEFGPVETEPLRSIRRKVAKKMTQASLLIAQVSHTDEVDVTELEALRRREREKRQGQPGGSLTLMAFVMKAVVAGLKQWRMFNASLDPFREQLVYKRYFNLGVAVDSPKGLLVPVVRDVDRRSVLEIAAAVQDVATRARQDRLTPADFRGGSFTVSNIGGIGGFSPNPIVNYPEVALLGMGRAEQKPVVVDGEIEIRTRLPVVISFDHRVADGGEAARFLGDLKRRLSDPMALLVEG